MCGAARASCCSGIGVGGEAQVLQEPCPPRGWVDIKLWPLPGPVTTSSHQRDWNARGNPTAQRSACHGPALGPHRGQEKQPQDQNILPAMEETLPQSRSPSHAAPRRVPRPDGSRPLAKTPCLFKHDLCLILGVLIMTGDLQPCPHPTSPARLVP